jgi:protein-S-isoprenylcysteine O-methyltransferase Ste14
MKRRDKHEEKAFLRGNDMATSAQGILAPVHSFFNDKGVRRLWRQYRFLIATILAVIFVVFIQPQFFYLAISVSLVGELVQLWCFASLKKQKVLACMGPYALVRNPMYLGRYFIVLGAILWLGVPGIYVALPYTILYGFYMVNRVRREEARLIEVFGSDYTDYCCRINRFFPSLKEARWKSVLFWKWDLLIGNHGVSNLVALFAAYGVLYFIAVLIHR